VQTFTANGGERYPIKVFRLYRLFNFGFPTCHERCARNAWMVIWDVGEDLETSFKIGLN